jgi:hypothetical protein
MPVAPVMARLHSVSRGPVALRHVPLRAQSNCRRREDADDEQREQDSPHSMLLPVRVLHPAVGTILAAPYFPKWLSMKRRALQGDRSQPAAAVVCPPLIARAAELFNRKLVRGRSTGFEPRRTPKNWVERFRLPGFQRVGGLARRRRGWGALGPAGGACRGRLCNLRCIWTEAGRNGVRACPAVSHALRGCGCPVDIWCRRAGRERRVSEA